MKRITILTVALVAMISSNLFAASWDFDKAHTNIGFTAKHLLVSTVHGKFTDYSGTVTFDEKNPTSLAMDVTIDVASINTENEKRDTHLRSDDFFNAEKFPKMTFKSKKTEVISPGKFKVTGDLTIRDVTKEITLDVEGLTDVVNAWGATKTGATATATVNRKDFNLKWNAMMEAGGAVVSDNIKILIDVELVKKEG